MAGIKLFKRGAKKDHLRIGRICESNDISRNALNEMRRDFFTAESIEDFLTRKKREPPVPSRITGEVEAYIIALACSKAPDGCARWTVRLLCDKSIELGYTDSIANMKEKAQVQYSFSLNPHRTSVDWAHKIKWLLTKQYAKSRKVVLIMDNLNMHGVSSLYNAFLPEEAYKLANRLEFHIRPKIRLLQLPILVSCQS